MSWPRYLAAGVKRYPPVLRSVSMSSEAIAPPLYDVVIAGGGMVGASLGAALGHNPAFADKKVLLLEAAPTAGRSLSDVCKGPTRSSRVCALSPGSVQLLQKFGAWDDIVKSQRYRAVKRMHVWESCSNAAITFDRNALTTDLAYIVENDLILAAISERLKDVKNVVQVNFSSKVKDFSPSSPGETSPIFPSDSRPSTSATSPSHFASSSSSWMRLRLEDGQTVDTRLLVGADGFQSLVRRTAGIHSVKWEYNQRAVVAVVELDTGAIADDEHDGGLNDTAWQRFTPSGPIALLPLTPKQSCLIWTTTPDYAKQLVQMSADSFTDSLNSALWTNDYMDPIAGYLGNLVDGAMQVVASSALGAFLSPSTRQLPPDVLGVVDGSRATFPLGLCHASRYVDRRVALVGDSAHRVHPLAGQGVNLGFGDVESLCDVLVDAVYEGRDLGSCQHLREYESSRQRRVVPIMAAIDGMNRIYGNTLTPLVMLRSAICRAANTITPINNAMIRYATR